MMNGNVKYTAKMAAVAVITGLVILMGSCATSSAPGPKPVSGAPAENKAAASAEAVKVSDSPMYYGTGSGSSQSAAINAAKLAAVKKAVNDVLGIASSMANREVLEEKVYGKVNVNALVYAESLDIISRSSDNGQYTVTAGVRINLPALADVLRGADIYGGQILPQGGKVALPDQQPVPGTGSSTGTASSGKSAGDSGSVAQENVNVSPDEAALINSIVNNLTYMVYYDEKTVSDPFIAKTAVGMANKYLSQKGMEYVDLEQIERIKKDQAAAYEAETGQSVSMLQWIAGKLNADIYIEISVDVNATTKDGKYYGSASVSLKNFDSSTGAGRGTAFYQTVPPAMSLVSEADAINNAVASATYHAIAKAVQQAELYTKKELVQGIRYSLVIQNTPDSKLMRTFMKKLEKKVKSVKRLSASSEETKYEVRLIGRMEDLEDIVYDVAESIPGLDGISLVYQRGNSITFDSGL